MRYRPWRTPGGTAVAAKEETIAEGVRLLAETEGIFTETAGGVVVSGLRELAKRGIIKPDEVTVAYITGNGLKTQEAVEEVVKPVYSAPDYDSFQAAMAAR